MSKEWKPGGGEEEARSTGGAAFAVPAHILLSLLSPSKPSKASSAFRQHIFDNKLFPVSSKEGAGQRERGLGGADGEGRERTGRGKRRW